MTNQPTLLIVDDEVQIQKLLSITLAQSGYRLQFADTAKEALQSAANHPPQLILLDLGLPDADGQEVLLRLREWYFRPIIILTAKDTEDEIVRALDNGANDYLTKPFRPQELLARIRTALRSTAESPVTPVLHFGDVGLDFANRSVRKGEVPVKLTATEYDLLALLASNEGRVLTHRQLLLEIWGPTYTSETQYLRVFIGQLRKKLEEDPNHPKFLLTESGIGYRFHSG